MSDGAVPDLFSWAEETIIEVIDEVPAPPKPLTVSELNKQIKTLLEGVYPEILVEGEISNFKAHSSGHYYFSLKDSGGQISAVMFRGANQRLKFLPQDGMKVLARGAISVYPQRGNYQILIQGLEPMGEGVLRLAFEQMKARLAAEGLFDAKYKIPLPKIPRRIAMVTSPTGAAIRDMIHVLSRRYPALVITLLPVRVQGETAAAEIATAIDLADRMNEFDVIIAGRGGGSLEDLWPFNEEVVARAIFRCRTPIVSAVGHEIDFTIADFVADVRAPTPSAAAEIVVPNLVDLLRGLQNTKNELASVLRNRFSSARRHLLQLERGLTDPRKRIQDGVLRLEDLSTQLSDWMRHALKNLSAKVQSHASVLDSLSPLAVLKRGYSIVTSEKLQAVLTSSGKTSPGDRLRIKLSEGEITAITE